MIDNNNNLIDGYIDYILAIKRGYDDVICAIDDTHESSAGRTNQRLKFFILQDGKCAICGNPIKFSNSSIISPYTEKICICPECRTMYSMLNQSGVASPIEMLRDLRKVLNEQKIQIKKLSIFTDDFGKYIQIKTHKTKIQPGFFEKISNKYKIRIRIKVV